MVIPTARPSVTACRRAADLRVRRAGIGADEFAMLAGRGSLFCVFPGRRPASGACAITSLRAGLKQAHSAQAGAFARRRRRDGRAWCSRAPRRPWPAGASRGSRPRLGAASPLGWLCASTMPGAAVHCGVGDDRADRESRAASRRPRAATRAGNRACIVDMRDPQASRAPGRNRRSSRRRSFARRSSPSIFSGKFGTLIPHAGSLGGGHGRRPLEPRPLWRAEYIHNGCNLRRLDRGSRLRLG